MLAKFFPNQQKSPDGGAAILHERDFIEPAFYDDHYAYMKDIVSKTDGWLIDYAAIISMKLLDYQDTKNYAGALLEIGVCAAKYFSILLRTAKRSGSLCVGLDTFQWLPKADVLERIETLLPGARYLFLEGASTSFTFRDIQDHLNNVYVRFMSIDGSHEPNDVVWDLRIAETVLSSEGIVALDDFYNPVALGVNDGTHRFFRTERNLVPFALFANKLLLCRPHMAKEYRKIVEELALADQTDVYSQFVINHQNNRGAIDQYLWGTKIVSFG